jgi:hypothetical protein
MFRKKILRKNFPQLYSDNQQQKFPKTNYGKKSALD